LIRQGWPFVGQAVLSEPVARVAAFARGTPDLVAAAAESAVPRTIAAVSAIFVVIDIFSTFLPWHR
jgi:hypothetical protein